MTAIREKLSAEERRELETAEQRHQWAARLLSDPAFNTAYEQLRNELLERIAATEPEQVETRDTLYFELRAMNRLASRLGYWMHNLERVQATLGIIAADSNTQRTN